MATRLLVPSEVCCKHEDTCKDRSFNLCNKCKNNKKSISKQVKESFFELNKERR